MKNFFTFRLRRVDIAVFGVLGFSAVPENGLFKISSSPIVKEEGVAVHYFSESDAPEWWGTPFGAGSIDIGAVIGESLSHVVKKEVGKRAEGNPAKAG